MCQETLSTKNKNNLFFLEKHVLFPFLKKILFPDLLTTTVIFVQFLFLLSITLLSMLYPYMARPLLPLVTLTPQPLQVVNWCLDHWAHLFSFLEQCPFAEWGPAHLRPGCSDLQEELWGRQQDRACQEPPLMDVEWFSGFLDFRASCGLRDCPLCLEQSGQWVP